MGPRLLAAVLLALAGFALDAALAFADHPPVDDEIYFTRVFLPVARSLPTWLIIGLLPALVLALLVAAAVWTWRAQAPEDQRARDEPG